MGRLVTVTNPKFPMLTFYLECFKYLEVWNHSSRTYKVENEGVEEEVVEEEVVEREEGDFQL